MSLIFKEDTRFLQEILAALFEEVVERLQDDFKDTWRFLFQVHDEIEKGF